jgi:hypothetical protein
MSRVSKILGENQTSKKKNLIEEVVDAIEIDDGKTTDLLMKYKTKEPENLDEALSVIR